MLFVNDSLFDSWVANPTPILGASTEVSVASRSGSSQNGEAARLVFGSSPTSWLTPVAFNKCFPTSFLIFLPRKASKTAVSAQGPAVARASSFNPRTVFIHQSVAQLEPHVPQFLKLEPLSERRPSPTARISKDELGTR